MKTYRMIGLLLLIPFFLYFNILSNELFYDDEELIYKNAFVQDLSNLPKYFSTNMVEGAGKVSNMYRPLLTLSFALDYAMWTKNPVGFHLSSIVLHAINGALIFLLLYKIFGNKIVALTTSALFVVHPIQTEAVAYASGRTDLLCAMFLLSSLLVFYYFIAEKKNSPLCYVLSFTLFVFAVLSKELAIVLPLLLILILIATKQLSKRNFLPILPFFGFVLLYFFLRLTVLNFSNSLNFYTTQTDYSQSLPTRIFTFSKVFFEYIWLLIFPKELAYSRDVEILQTPTNIWTVLFILSAIGFVYFCKRFRGKYPAYVFACLWFIILLIPASGIIPINSIMQEHYLYLPSIGFFLIISFLIYSLLSRNVAIPIFVIVCIGLSLRTYIRNMDWKDPIAFYTKSLQTNPNNIAMRNNLAMSYADKGYLEKAVKEYQELIRIADVYPNTHHNLGNAYKTQRRYADAEAEYRKALTMDAKFYFSYYALYEMYETTGEKEKLGELMEEMKMKDLLKYNL